MRPIVLAATVTAALGVASAAGMLLPNRSSASSGVLNVADTGTKAAELPPTRAVVIPSDREPVPIARKPMVPSAEDAVASSNPEPNERNRADQPALPAPPPQVRAGSNAEDREKPVASAVPFPPDGARPNPRVVISRGNQSDSVVISVDRHLVVIRGWRIQ